MRYLSIDILRAVAILLMIQTHFADNLSSDATLLHDISFKGSLPPAPLFTLLSGASYGLWLRKQQAQHRSEDEITKITVRRGLFLFGAGLAFKILVWLPEHTFDWDVLTLIGASIVVLAFARKLPTAALVVPCVLIWIALPFLREKSGYFDGGYWDTGPYLAEFTFHDVLLGFFFNAYFPFFAWIIFPVMGFVVGGAVFKEDVNDRSISRPVLVAGCSMIALALLGWFFREHAPASIQEKYLKFGPLTPGSPLFLLLALGASMTSLVLFHRWIDQNPNISGRGWGWDFFRLYSAYSLTVYIAHHAAHLWPLWLSAAWNGLETDDYYAQATDTPTALGLALAFIVACYFALLLVDRHGKYGFESLMRWVCD